ncbi:MAG: hypothetical protein IPK82_06415 [Polyangiaceae bacterium]|nr:hypothetical protein [Polyangiaceae bacterium]
MKYASSIGLAFALALAGIASACGPATPDSQTPPTPTADATATAAPTAAPTAEPTAAPTAAPTVAPTAAPTTTAVAPPAPPGPAIKATAFAEDLKKAGFDLAKMPPKLDKMTDAQKKKIMPLFVKALGYENCTGCHVDGDFKKKTRNIHIAEHMYDEFVAALRDEKGGATVFCDSCHQGKPKVLNRADKEAVGKYMDEQYVNKFARADKKKNECASCHGDPPEMKIFDKKWQVAKGL